MVFSITVKSVLFCRIFPFSSSNFCSSTQFRVLYAVVHVVVPLRGGDHVDVVGQSEARCEDGPRVSVRDGLRRHPRRRHLLARCPFERTARQKSQRNDHRRHRSHSLYLLRSGGSLEIVSLI